MPHDRALATFLVTLAVLLAVARLLGEGARRLGLPAVSGELFTGVLLGPSLLGRVWPGSAALLPVGVAGDMLRGYTLLGAVLLLTLAGLEIDISVVLARRRQAALTSIAGVVFPLAMGFGLGLLLPDRAMVDPAQRTLFAMFLGVALSISAMPVIAKTLLDLGLFRTDMGMLVMAAATVDDLVGWLLFSLLVPPMRGESSGGAEVLVRVAVLVAFLAAVLLLGRPLFHRVLARVAGDDPAASARVLTLVVVAALLGAGATESLGVHAALGAFVTGVAIGDSPRLREETRQSLRGLANNVFAPVFFAAVGLRVDFVGGFDPLLVGSVVVVAFVAKIVGCTLGARVGGLAWRKATSVGVAMSSRGAMEVLLALVALDAGLIRRELFVALVVMALVTSLVAGPTMRWLLHAPPADDPRA